jgi:MoxR-like ATPase
MSEQPTDSDLGRLQRLKEAHDQISDQVAQTIVGQRHVVELVLSSIFARGHCILEGVPGLAKTLLVSTLARSLSLDFSRVQFTPDLMPSDITGTEVMQEDRSTGDREFRFVHGPIFTHVLLADEINRTPPKTQAALLEGMQERQVSAGGRRHLLPDPFFVLATQNPIEQEGTYSLPEAQLDRFLVKIFVDYPSADEERKIYRLSTGSQPPDPEKLLSADEILELQEIVRRIAITDFTLDYSMALIRATRPTLDDAPDFIKEWVVWGAGPRAGQALILVSKARAALDGRPEVDVEDIKAMAKPVLRHRLVLNYNAEAEGQTPDLIVDRLLETIPVRPIDEEDNARVKSVLKS